MTTFLPTLKQLHYLVALKQHGHFGRAADSCFVTQSTLSAGLRELESLLGVTLVERTRRVVRFTPLGDRVVAKARQILMDAEALADLARVAARPLSGDLRLSVIPTIAPFLLPDLLPRLAARYPDLNLFLREETSAIACDSLNRGLVDGVILARPFPCGDVEVAPLFNDPLHVAFRRGDTPDPPASIAPSAIDERRLLLLLDGHCLKDHALAACNRPELSESATMMGTSLHTIVQMVDNGLGVTLLPEMAIAAGLLRGTSVDSRPLAAERARREVALVWRRSSPRARDFTLLAEVVREAHSARRAQAPAECHAAC